VLHDIELFGLSRPEINGSPNAGLPETVKAADSEVIRLPEAWQWYWYRLLELSAQAEHWTGDVLNEWRKITRSNAFKTNGNGVESGYANYPSKANIGAKPIGSEVIVTGAHIF